MLATNNAALLSGLDNVLLSSPGLDTSAPVPFPNLGRLWVYAIRLVSACQARAFQMICLCLCPALSRFLCVQCSICSLFTKCVLVFNSRLEAKVLLVQQENCGPCY